MKNPMNYIQNGDYLIPDLKLSQQPEKPLGKRKSRGCFHILCFIYDSDLFVFGEEETQL